MAYIDYDIVHSEVTSFFSNVAPSSPRDVRVRQIRPLLVEVSWRAPAISNGVITHYTVYAIPKLSYEATRSKRQTTSPPQTIKKVKRQTFLMLSDLKFTNF